MSKDSVNLENAAVECPPAEASSIPQGKFP
jgi:hypothetical protein